MTHGSRWLKILKSASWLEPHLELTTAIALPGLSVARGFEARVYYNTRIMHQRTNVTLVQGHPVYKWAPTWKYVCFTSYVRTMCVIRLFFAVLDFVGGGTLVTIERGTPLAYSCAHSSVHAVLRLYEYRLAVIFIIIRRVIRARPRIYV